jgi:hypothetical protein
MRRGTAMGHEVVSARGRALLAVVAICGALSFGCCTTSEGYAPCRMADGRCVSQPYREKTRIVFPLFMTGEKVFPDRTERWANVLLLAGSSSTIAKRRADYVWAPYGEMEKSSYLIPFYYWHTTEYPDRTERERNVLVLIGGTDTIPRRHVREERHDRETRRGGREAVGPTYSTQE